MVSDPVIGGLGEHPHRSVRYHRHAAMGQRACGPRDRHWWLLGALGSSGALGGILGSMGLGEAATSAISAGTGSAKLGGNAAPPPSPPPAAPPPAAAAEPPPSDGGGGLLGGLTPGGGSSTAGVPPLLQRPPQTTASLPTLGAVTDVPELGQYGAGAAQKPTPDTYPLSGPNLGPQIGPNAFGGGPAPMGGPGGPGGPAGGAVPSDFWQSPFGRYLQARTPFGPHQAGPGQGGIDLGNPGALPGSGGPAAGGMGVPQVAPGIIQMAPGLQGPTMGAQNAVAAGLGQSGAPGTTFGQGQGGGIERVLQALLRQRQGPAARSLPVTSTLPGGNAFYW